MTTKKSPTRVARRWWNRRCAHVEDILIVNVDKRYIVRLYKNVEQRTHFVRRGLFMVFATEPVLALDVACKRPIDRTENRFDRSNLDVGILRRTKEGIFGRRLNLYVGD